MRAWFICHLQEKELGSKQSWHTQVGCYFGAALQPSMKDVLISDDSLRVHKMKTISYKPCVIYSTQPLLGRSVFEVEVSLISTRPLGRLMIGICRMPKECPVTKFHLTPLPYESNDYCVWHNGALWNNLSIIHIKKSYGTVHLMSIKSKDRIGFLITGSGDLLFYVNGQCQGLAARNVYLEGCDVYAVVSMLETCHSITVTRSGMQYYLSNGQ